MKTSGRVLTRVMTRVHTSPMTTNAHLDSLRATLDSTNEELSAARRRLVEVQHDDEQYMDQEEVVAAAEEKRQSAYDAWHAADLVANPPYEGDDI